MSQTRNLSNSRDELDRNYTGTGAAPPRRNLNHASRLSLNTPLSGIRNDQDMERHCSQEKLDASLDNSRSTNDTYQLDKNYVNTAGNGYLTGSDKKEPYGPDNRNAREPAGNSPGNMNAQLKGSHNVSETSLNAPFVGSRQNFGTNTVRLPEVQVMLPSGPELQPPNGPSQDNRNGSGGVRPKTGKAYLTLPASDDKMQVAGAPSGPPPPKYPDLFPQAARPATDSNTHSPIPTPTAAGMGWGESGGSCYTGHTTHGTAPPYEGPESGGFFNLAMDYGIAEEPDVHRGGKSFDLYLPKTDGAGGVIVKQPNSLFVRKTNDNSAPHFNVWIGLSFVGLLCCGVVPGLVALIFIWQSRFEWEQGQRETGRASLTKGKVALVVTLLLGAAGWAYLIYYIDAMNKPDTNSYRYG